VFISGVLSPHGVPARLLAAWRAGEFLLVLSPAILAEIGRVLSYPRIVTRHGWSERQRVTFLEDLEHLAVLTPGATRLRAIEADPADNRYLECAVEGEADCIVSGDAHLLGLGIFRGIEILSPAAFLEILAPGR